MACPRCQHENRPPATFCEACGTPLTVASSTARSYADLRREVERLGGALAEALEQQTATAEVLQARNHELSEAQEQQTATSEILRVIASSPTDVQQVFETIAQHAVRICDGRDCLVYRFDGTLVDIVAERETSPNALRELRRVSIGIRLKVRRRGSHCGGCH